MTQHAKQAANLIQQKISGITPKLGIVLGSGLGVLADRIENAAVFDYDELPGFPKCSVEGHGGRLYIGKLNGVDVACLQGRAHFYEGTSPEIFKTMIRTLKLLGCETLLATNSSGSLRQEVPPGSLVVINDHINMQFTNVLMGQNDDEFGPRFVGMDATYDKGLRQHLFAVAKEQDIHLHEGVYIGVIGPTFETPAEIRAFRTMGAEVVGMSTIPDVMIARHCGMRVMVISVITNYAAGMSDEHLSHEGTLRGAKEAADKLVQLVFAFVKQYGSVELGDKAETHQPH